MVVMMGVVDGGPAEGNGDHSYRYRVTVTVFRAVAAVAAVARRVVKIMLEMLVVEVVLV